jgi:hypothetical protein
VRDELNPRDRLAGKVPDAEMLHMWNEGRALSFDEAVAIARKLLSEAAADTTAGGSP